MHELDLPEINDLASELAVVVRAGLDRPLYRADTEADIQRLAAVASILASDSTASSRRQIAEAVRVAMKQIAPPVRRDAIAMLFGTDLGTGLDDPDIPAARPKLDDDRRPKVARLLGVSVSSYRRYLSTYEQPLLAEVAEQLLALATEKDSAYRRPYRNTLNGMVNGFAVRPARTLEQFAQDTADLHCALVAGLFVKTVGMEVHPSRGHHNRIYVHGRYRVDYDCADTAFLAHLRWITTYRHATFWSVVEEHDRICDYLGNYLMAQFEELTQSIEQLAGVDSPADRKAIQDYVGLYQGVKFLPPYTKAQARTFTPDVVAVIHHFESKWLPLFWREDVPPALTRAASRTGLLLSLIADRDNQKELDFLSKARRNALNRLSSYYEAEHWESLPDGMSLRTRAEAYFGTVGSELAKI